MSPPTWNSKCESTTTPIAQKRRKEVRIKKPLRENLIFIGSEMSYDSFWLKMMFIGASYRVASHGELFRTADKNTLVYVDIGYVTPEKLALDYLVDNCGFTVKKIASEGDVVSVFNADRDSYKLQDVAFFSHGLVGKISLNYNGDPNIDLDSGMLGQLRKDSFVSDGKIYSYACRTGVSVEDFMLGFDDVSEAKPEESLAQKMADYFNVDVHAFLRRTFYGSVLREESHSNYIASTLKATRERQDNDLLVVDIPDEHEGLPHPGLADNGVDILFFESGPVGEGTDNYALWRKRGGRRLPVAADTPKGLPSEMRVFSPR